MMKIKTVNQEPCGQHTVWEPLCKTCRRLAGAEAERDRLRDALRAVLESGDRLAAHPDNPLAQLWWAQGARTARAALAKAEGREP